MQKAYVNALYDLISKDKNVISCLSDSGTDYDELIAREFPAQCLNFGISENNKVGVASGLAACGKIPFVYTTNAFLSYRSYEFIRDDICLQNRNVKLVGMGCGLSWSTLGPTHHTTEDISALKAIPNLTIFSPASPLELAECVKRAYEIKGPVYIRMGMSGEKEIYEENINIKVEKNVILQDGKSATVFSTGSIISELMDASNMLKQEGINIRIINIPIIKPLDVESIKNECINQSKIFSLEEHNVTGGIGSSIADVIATNNIDAKLTKIGIEDTFAEGYGTYQEIKKMNHLDAKSIYEKIKENI